MKNLYVSLSFLILLLLYPEIGSSTDLLKDPPKLCVAVRGNGEVVFAHWPALAQIVEHYGPIDMLSGGSSASISIFLYESVVKNPLLSCPDNNAQCITQKSHEIALLLKSFQGYFDYWITTNEVNALRVLYTHTPEFMQSLKFWKKRADDLREESSFQKLSFLKQAKVLIKHVDILLKSTDLKKIINPELINFLKESADALRKTSIFNVKEFKRKLRILKFRFDETRDSVSIVLSGGFDAKNDGRLFFRPGLISFEDVAHKFGRMADFYSGYFYPNPYVQKNNPQRVSYMKGMRQFLNVCTPGSVNKSWTQLAYNDYLNDELSPCGVMFREVVKNYREQLMADEKLKVVRQHRIEDAIGQYEPGKSVGIFPITSVINKEQSLRYSQLVSDYKTTSDDKFGLDYSIPYDGIFFGYWGSADQVNFAIDNIKQGALASDLKSSKMMALGQTLWKHALAVSGAEPGLSPIKPIPGNADNLYSAGGWADLHPTLLLKSLNCQNTVYITRINGETVFGQGVVKRLLDLSTPSWERIDPKAGEPTRINNNNGDAQDLDSTWSRLYNIANPQSSISLSLKAADAVWCTDWDSFDIKKGYTPLIDHSYNDAKLYINQKSSSRKFFAESFADLKPFNMEERLLSLESHTYERGWPSYVGCVPLSE